MKKLLTLTITAVLLSFASFATVYPFSPSSGGGCVGGWLYLTDSLSPGGTWSSSNTAIATVNTAGDVYGVSSGIVTITYTIGSSYTTGTFTFDPMPAPILGASHDCVGSTITLTDATPGGTWSTDGLESIDPVSGVATALWGGYDYVYYTVGACSSVAMDTINANITGSIAGPNSVCPGSTIILVDSSGGGIIWSSSDLSVATVDPSTGLVSGIATGTATISLSYSGVCGTTYATYNISVGAGDPGMLYGPGSLSVGTTSYVYAYGGTGTVTSTTWTSSDPSIATVDGSGNVTGVAAGTVTISYTATICGTATTLTTNIIVTPLDGISGYVNFPGGYYGTVMVWLITYNPSTMDLEASDSTTVYCSGTSIYYQFTGLVTDSFRVKASGFDSSTVITGFIPTYHTSNFYWHDANVIYHTAGTSDINEDINMVTGSVSAGPGFIGGNVTTGANKTTSGAIPAIGLKMNIVNSATSQLMGMTRTDASGNYAFNNLPVGATYYVFPDSLNYGTTAYTSITLTASAPSMNVASFTQHTLSKTITPGSTLEAGIIPNAIESVIAFPNPSNGKLNIQWTLKATEKGSVIISDVTGRQVYSSALNMTEGTATRQLDLSALTDGLYLISIKSTSVSYNSKIQIQH